MKIIDFKNASCKHCYKCVRSCSVKAIRVKNAQAQIMKEYCILCGKCLEVCPQNLRVKKLYESFGFRELEYIQMVYPG